MKPRRAAWQGAGTGGDTRLIIDAHQHFWRVARGDYGWLESAPDTLRRDFEPADLAPLLARCGIEASVLVQAAPSEAETDFLLDLAAQTTFVAAVVGWTDLEASDVGERLTRLAARAKLKGVRPMIQDTADPDWMLGSAARGGFEALEASGLVLDALVRPHHLPRLEALAQRHPRLPIVIDHAAKPDIAAGAFRGWASSIERLAAHPQVVCKLSGLLTEAGARTADADLARFVRHVLEAFGPARTMWGSDWPVLTLAAGYDRWWDQANRLAAGLTFGERAQVFGLTAQRVYGVEGGKGRLPLT
jgi:L-fuconolactonase